MNDNKSAATTLVVAIPDPAMRQAVIDALPGNYTPSVSETLNGLDAVTAPTLILCHQSLIAQQPHEPLMSLVSRFSGSRVLVIGPPVPMEMQIAALKAGARGYFNQDMPMSRLHDALQLILQGEVWVERHVVSGLIDELTHAPRISDEQRQALDTLTPKELEVARLVSHGATNKMIARAMNITERTVKAHLTTIFQKMNIPDRLSLAIFFRDLR